MITRARLLLVALAILALVALAGCGAKPATLSDIPAFPESTELKAGESQLADTLTQNNQTDAAMRGQLGVGGATEQKGFVSANKPWVNFRRDVVGSEQHTDP